MADLSRYNEMIRALDDKEGKYARAKDAFQDTIYKQNDVLRMARETMANNRLYIGEREFRAKLLKDDYAQEAVAAAREVLEAARNLRPQLEKEAAAARAKAKNGIDRAKFDFELKNAQAQIAASDEPVQTFASLYRDATLLEDKTQLAALRTVAREKLLSTNPSPTDDPDAWAKRKTLQKLIEADERAELAEAAPELETIQETLHELNSVDFSIQYALNRLQSENENLTYSEILQRGHNWAREAFEGLAETTGGLTPLGEAPAEPAGVTV